MRSISILASSSNDCLLFVPRVCFWHPRPWFCGCHFLILASVKADSEASLMSWVADQTSHCQGENDDDLDNRGSIIHQPAQCHRDCVMIDLDGYWVASGFKEGEESDFLIKMRGMWRSDDVCWGEKRDEEGVLELAWDERKRGSGARWSDLGPNSAHQPTTETQKTDQCKLLCNKAQNSGITNILVTSPSVKLIRAHPKPWQHAASGFSRGFFIFFCIPVLFGLAFMGGMPGQFWQKHHLANSGSFAL